MAPSPKAFFLKRLDITVVHFYITALSQPFKGHGGSCGPAYNHAIADAHIVLYKLLMKAVTKCQQETHCGGSPYHSEKGKQGTKFLTAGIANELAYDIQHSACVLSCDLFGRSLHKFFSFLDDRTRPLY